MAYKNVKDLLTDATKLPAAIEAKLPEGAPKVSTMLLDTAGKIPAVPDFPMEIPDLPAPPEFPEITPPGGGGGLKLPFVTSATVRPVSNTVKREVIPSPATGVIPERRTRRGM